MGSSYGPAAGEERIMVFIKLGFAALVMLSTLHTGHSELTILKHHDEKVAQDGMVNQVDDLETAPSHGHYGYNGGYGHGYGGYGHGGYGYGHGYSYGQHGYGYGGHGYSYGHHGYQYGHGGYGRGYGGYGY